MQSHIDYADEFPLDEDLIYLNHAAVAPWPRRTAAAVTEFAQQNLRSGAANYLQWVQRESELRVMLGRLINAGSADDIALLKNTSEGLSFIAAGLDWKPGDNIVISDQEFPSNRIVWEALASKGVVVKRAALPDTDPEGSLIASCDNRTRLLAISSVQYASGLRMNLERLGEYCVAKHILLCVDAIQSLGALPLDVQTCRAHFVVADAHKWMLGPEGIALFYVAPELRSQLRLTEFGWHMVEHPGDYDRLEWQPAGSARRFECGSPNMLGIHAFHASLSLLFEIGIDRIAERILENTDFLMQCLAQSEGLQVMSSTVTDRRSGIATFQAPDVPAKLLAERLNAKRIICACRGGGVRFSPHFYTSSLDLEKAVQAADGIAKAGR